MTQRAAIVGRLTSRARPGIWAAVLLGPAALMIGAGMVLPAIQTARLSVLSPDGRQFVGLSNFGWVLTSPNARQALANSLAWALAVPMASVILGLALALAVHRMRRRSLPLALLAMPMAMSYVGTCVAWLWLQPRSTPALMAIMTWVLAGLALLLLGAAIAAIPADILQAAQLDGAQGWLLLFRVILPMIKDTLVVCLAVVAILAVRAFDIVRVTTNGADGTGVLASEQAIQAFDQAESGRASALAVVLLAIAAPAIAWGARRMRRGWDVR